MKKILWMLIFLLCVGYVSAQIHPADLDQNGCIDLGEISSYVSSWLQGDVTLGEVSNAVSLWLEGCTTGSVEKLTILSASSTKNTEIVNPVWHSYDGDLLTRWASEPIPVDIDFDLFGAQEIHETRFSFYNWNSGRVYGYSILTSVDGISWTEVVSLRNSVLDQWTTDSFTPVDARYVRLHIQTNSQSLWAGLWEAEIWGVELNPPPECVDNDGDAYGEFCPAGLDCNDNDANVWSEITCAYDGNSCGNYQMCAAFCPVPPMEICDNQQDDDCDGFIDDGCGGGDVLLVNFDNQNEGEYTDSDVYADWPGTVWVMGGSRKYIIGGAEAYSGKSLRILYPQGGIGPSQSGSLWPVDLPELYDELYVSYMVKFEEGYHWTSGGKLPGLCGGDCQSGGTQSQKGWSSRIMWSSPGDMTQYVYWPYNPSNWGDHFRWDNGGQKYFIPGTWHEVKTRIKMNTAGQQNGILQSWFDGQLALDKTDMDWRHPSYPNVGIDQFIFSTFHGGNTANYAPDHDQYIYYDNFVVSTTP